VSFFFLGAGDFLAALGFLGAFFAAVLAPDAGAGLAGAVFSISISKMAPRSSSAMVGAPPCTRRRHARHCLLDQLHVIHGAEHEEQLRRRVQAIAHAV